MRYRRRRVDDVSQTNGRRVGDRRGGRRRDAARRPIGDRESDREAQRVALAQSVADGDRAARHRKIQRQELAQREKEGEYRNTLTDKELALRERQLNQQGSQFDRSLELKGEVERNRGVQQQKQLDLAYDRLAQQNQQHDATIAQRDRAAKDRVAQAGAVIQARADKDRLALQIKDHDQAIDAAETRYRAARQQQADYLAAVRANTVNDDIDTQTARMQQYQTAIDTAMQGVDTAHAGLQQFLDTVAAPTPGPTTTPSTPVPANLPRPAAAGQPLTDRQIAQQFLAAAGGDPAAQVREFAGRISLVHLKGLQRDPFGFTPLDAGDLDNGAVIQALKDTNYSGWVMAELDSWPDPYEGAARSHAFLKRHFV